MSKLNNLNEEEIKFLKEANVVIDANKEYTVDERKYMVNQAMGYIMNFSKNEISDIFNKYGGAIDKIARY